MEIIKDTFSEEIKEGLNRLGIKAILFDFDDTLIFTAEIFLRQMDEYVNTVAAKTGIDPKTLDESLRRINDEEYKKVGVNPLRWAKTLEKMATEFQGSEEVILDNLGILMEIYNQEPRVRPGARAILEVLKRTGVKMGLVTHANVDWTWKKLQYSGMIDYFETIVIADENGHKDIKCWQTAMEDLGVLATECLVVGDSLNGDIIPTAGIGARTMWLHNGSSWSVNRTGAVPESTVHLGNVNELLSAVEALG